MSAQIRLPQEFVCRNGFLVKGSISFSSFPLQIKAKNTTDLKNKLRLNSELCCGVYSSTKEGLIIGKGSQDSEGEGAGNFFYRIFDLKRNMVLVVSSPFNNTDFKDWCSWALRSVRGVSSEKSIYPTNFLGQKCK